MIKTHHHTNIIKQLKIISENKLKVSALSADLRTSLCSPCNKYAKFSGVYSPLLYHGAWAIAMVTFDVPWGDICP